MLFDPTRPAVDGAWPNGSRVVKEISDPTDLHPNGSVGTVLGSLAVEGQGIAYVVIFDSISIPTLVSETKLTRMI